MGSSDSVLSAGSIISHVRLAAAVRTAVEEIVPPAGLVADGLPLPERRLLEQGGFACPQTASSFDSVMHAVVLYAALLATSLTVTDAAAVLGCDLASVRRLIHSRHLYGVKNARRWCLPRWQFTDALDRLTPSVSAVVQALDPRMHPVSVTRWFTSPSRELVGDDDAELSPRVWLLQGRDPGKVTGLAAGLGAS